MTAMTNVMEHTERDTIEVDRDLVERASALRGLIEEHAEESSNNHRIVPLVMDSLRDAGLLKLTVPRRFGGHETNSRTYTEVLRELARGDGSTAWTTMLLNIGNWFATTWSEKAQQEIWGDNPEAGCCIVLAPGAVGERGEGGYTITGAWPYASASFAATHAIMGFLATNSSGEKVPALAILQPGEWEIERTWNPIGLKGTGSDTVRTTATFVPDYRIQMIPDLVEGNYATEYARSEPRSRAPFLATGTIIFGAIQVGLGRAVFENIVERLRFKGVVGTAYSRSSDSPSHQITIARASAKIDAAEQIMFRACFDIDQAAIDDEYPSELTRARIRNDTGFIVEQINEAIDILLKAAGSSSFMLSSSLSRVFQDAFVGGSHVHATPGIATDVYGKLLLGYEGPLPVAV